ncbi:MAG: hypothetical protein P8Y40_12795 [Desulfobacterales bacterium]
MIPRYTIIDCGQNGKGANRNLSMIPIDVDSYAGYRGEETPRRIRFKTHTVAVKAVLDRWLSPGHRYFKLEGDNGDLYIIRHDPHQGLWELTFYRTAEIP